MTTKENDNEKPAILIVDDDRQVLKSLKIWFKNEGLNPIIASNGDEAIKAMSENTVDVALVDLRMSMEEYLKKMIILLTIQDICLMI